MKTWKRLNVLVVLAVLLALAVPTVIYAGEAEGITARSSAREMKITGVLEKIGEGYVVVGEQTITVATSTEIEGSPMEGDVVEVYARVAIDGTFVAREIEPADDDVFNGNENNSDNSNATDEMGNANDDDLSNVNDNGTVDNVNSNESDDLVNGNSNDDDMSNANDDDHSNPNDDDHSNSNDDDRGNDNDDDN